MNKIVVTIQDRFNPRQYTVDSDGDSFMCPVCHENNIEVKIKKNVDNINYTYMSAKCHCSICGNNYSLNRM